MVNLVGSRQGDRVGQAEDKVDLNKVQLKGKQIRRGMRGVTQNMGVSDMEYMDVQGGEEEIQARLYQVDAILTLDGIRL